MLNIIKSTIILQMKHSFSRPTFKFIILLQPIFNAILYYLIFKGNPEINIGIYILVSVGLINLWSTIIYSSASDIERERFMGTLEVIYAAPTDFRIIFLGKIIGNLILGIFSTIISYIVLIFIFSVKLEIINPFYFSIAFLLTVISFSALSMVMGYIFTLSRNSRLFMNILEYPIYILCGIVVPIEFLPSPLRWIAYLLPPTWAAKLLRSSIEGIHSFNNFWYNFLSLVIITLLILLIAHQLYKKVEYKTRFSGDLGVH